MRCGVGGVGWRGSGEEKKKKKLPVFFMSASGKSLEVWFVHCSFFFFVFFVLVLSEGAAGPECERLALIPNLVLQLCVAFFLLVLLFDHYAYHQMSSFVHFQVAFTALTFSTLALAPVVARSSGTFRSRSHAPTPHPQAIIHKSSLVLPMKWMTCRCLQTNNIVWKKKMKNIRLFFCFFCVSNVRWWS